MADGQRFAVFAVFDVKAGAFNELRAAALEDAADSVRKEADCFQFDVLVPTSAGNRLALYEVYTSKEAFLKHLETPHCLKFLALADKATSGRHVTELYLAGGASKGATRS